MNKNQAVIICRELLASELVQELIKEEVCLIRGVL